jgi:hypothetical protein
MLGAILSFLTKKSPGVTNCPQFWVCSLGPHDASENRGSAMWLGGG